MLFYSFLFSSAILSSSPSTSSIKVKAIGTKLAHATPLEEQQTITKCKWISGSIDGVEDKRYRQENKVTQKIMILVEHNLEYNYIELLIGLGRSELKALQVEGGRKAKIQVWASKGVNNNLLDDDTEPLYILLESEKEYVSKAEDLIDKLLEDSEKANTKSS